ncbi:MAG: hypothetical protein BWY07_02012 [Candidatus Hydrogenedentes bacterium ADurb.Bin170]|nr:MAG: hypothetical protein BWY07_02012 [Candidatus Hydrogenedentes bacterium ADurb.Bin170]
MLISTWTYSGMPGGGPVAGCCFLLLASPSSELLLLQSGCLTPLSCTSLSALALQSSDDDFLLLQSGGTDFLALEDVIQ